MLNGLYSIGQTSIFIPPFFQISTQYYGDFVQLKNFISDDKIDYFYERKKNRFETVLYRLNGEKLYLTREDFYDLIDKYLLPKLLI